MPNTTAEPQVPPIQAPRKRRWYLRPWFIIPAVVAVAVLGLIVAGAGRHFVTGTAGPAPAGALWWNEVGGGRLVVSPDGTTVFVTGAGTRGEDNSTVAYRADTGARLWAAQYPTANKEYGRPAAVAVSPDGRTVFVTGIIAHGASRSDYGTVAYRADTGARLWAKFYGNGQGGASSVAVSPDGTKVFVTGTRCTSFSKAEGCSRADHATIAYRAGTGTQLWAQRYTDGGGANVVAVSPDGRTVFVTGESTVAYRANTGAQLWAVASHIYGAALAVSPDGRTVFVAGSSQYLPNGPSEKSERYATVAYRAGTGAQLWAKFYGNGQGGAESVAVSPEGATVFVTGRWDGTVAYRTDTGAQLWAKPFISGSEAWDVVVSPDGTKVFVTGCGFAIGHTTTVAYNPATGAQLWAKWSDGGSSYMAAAVSPDSSRIFVTGVTTVAYPAG